MAPTSRRQNIDHGLSSCGLPANDQALFDRDRCATPQARIYSSDVIGIAQNRFPIARQWKKALKTIVQEDRRRACPRLDKASAQRRT
jgi:hypothetical protein